MLIQDPSQHGDKAINPEEGLAKLKEENAGLLEPRKLHKQAELEDQDRAAGPRMPYTQVIYRILQCNPEVVVKDGSEGNVALYAPIRDADGTVELSYVGGIPKEWIPEFSYITVDERGMPKRELRGWRSVLISMIKSRVLTYNAVIREFGEPLGQRAWRWQEQLQRYK